MTKQPTYNLSGLYTRIAKISNFVSPLFAEVMEIDPGTCKVIPKIRVQQAPWQIENRRDEEGTKATGISPSYNIGTRP